MSNDLKIGMPAVQLPKSPSVGRPSAGKEEATVAGATDKAPAVATKAAVAPPAEQIEAVARRLETYLRSVSRALEFRVDSTTGRTVVSVRDGETGELIRQIPGEDVLRLAEMADDQTVVLVNEKV